MHLQLSQAFRELPALPHPPSTPFGARSGVEG